MVFCELKSCARKWIQNETANTYVFENLSIETFDPLNSHETAPLVKIQRSSALLCTIYRNPPPPRQKYSILRSRLEHTLYVCSGEEGLR
jgi:hypothetical protein